jgi:hypothetical protein
MHPSNSYLLTLNAGLRAALSLALYALDRMAQGEPTNDVIEDTGVTARVTEALHDFGTGEPTAHTAVQLFLDAYARAEVTEKGLDWEDLDAALARAKREYPAAWQCALAKAREANCSHTRLLKTAPPTAAVN